MTFYAKEVIRDRTGKRFGTIIQEGDLLVPNNIQNVALGYHDPKDRYTHGLTQRLSGKTITCGNCLASRGLLKSQCGTFGPGRERAYDALAVVAKADVVHVVKTSPSDWFARLIARF